MWQRGGAPWEGSVSVQYLREILSGVTRSARQQPRGNKLSKWDFPLLLMRESSCSRPACTRGGASGPGDGRQLISYPARILGRRASCSPG